METEEWIEPAECGAAVSDGGDQREAPYAAALAAWAARGPARLHVPGHGAGGGADPALVELIGPGALRIDVPQDTDGVDLGPAPAPYARAELLAAEAHGAGRTWFLTNGATQGNHAICLALAPAGAELVAQRNCHGSVIDGLVLSGGAPVWLSPGHEPGLGFATVVTPDALRTALRQAPQARVALIVSPTYFGLVADVAGCAAVAREAGVTLVVDGAWGAHFGFHPALPDNPLRDGADVVLTSTHKHGGSLTQSAMLHVAAGRDDLVASLGRALRLLRSTSPSALLLASLDTARRQLAARGSEVLGEAVAAAALLRALIEPLAGCRVIDRCWAGPPVAAWDPLRVAVDVRGTGVEATALARWMRAERDVHPELATAATLLFLVPFGLTAATAERTVAALRDAIAARRREGDVTSAAAAIPLAPTPPRSALTPRDAFLGGVETVPRERAVGRVCAEAISAYPPGIPALLPGEPVTRAALDQLLALRAAGVRLHGAADPDLSTLVVSEHRP